MTCVTCPDGQYWSAVDKVCHVCPYATYNSTYCEPGAERQVDNLPINIDLRLTMRTATCTRYFYSFEKYYTVFLNGNVFYSRINQTRWYPCYGYHCNNLEFKIVNNEPCVPDISCGNGTCDNWKTDVQLSIFYARQYIQPDGTSMHYRSTVDVLLQYLYDLNPEATSNLQLRFQLPFKPTVTFPDINASRLYVNLTMNSSAGAYFSTSNWTDLEIVDVENIQISDCITSKCVSFSILFKTKVDDTLVNKIAEYFIQFHEKYPHSSQGSTITGPIMIYRSYQDVAAGINAFNWCDVINRLSLAEYFCASGDLCVDMDSDGNFICSEDNSTSSSIDLIDTSTVNTFESFTVSSSDDFDISSTLWYLPMDSSDLSLMSSPPLYEYSDYGVSPSLTEDFYSSSEILPSSLTEDFFSSSEILPSSVTPAWSDVASSTPSSSPTPQLYDLNSESDPYSDLFTSPSQSDSIVSTSAISLMSSSSSEFQMTNDVYSSTSSAESTLVHTDHTASYSLSSDTYSSATSTAYYSTTINVTENSTTATTSTPYYSTTANVSEDTSTTSSTPYSSTTASSSSTTQSTTTTTRTTTTSTTTPSVSSRKQRALYPYGTSFGDSEIPTSGGAYFYYWYDAISDPINFSTGVPFGSQIIKVAHVLPNGVITFGKQKRVWWPDLQYVNSYMKDTNILAPFWTYTNPQTNGKIFYHLYEKSSVGATDVLQRATIEVREQFKLSNFNATVALVATWENVEPYSWYIWLCEYYVYYQQYYWWDLYYQYYYNKYCLNKIKETNTFQAVYITDGLTSYAIVTYKEGAMKWLNEEWRTIQVGFVHADDVRDYGVTYTDLTTKMDTIIWNSGRYGTWIEKVGESQNPGSLCNNFYLKNKYLLTDTLHQQRVKALFECPCTLGQMGAQWWYHSWDALTEGPQWSYSYCFAISPMAKSRLARFQGNPLNKLCCYKYTYPDFSQYWSWESWFDAWRNAPYIPYRDPNAGHLLLNDPWWWWSDVRKSREEDFNPHRWCCEESSSPWYYCGLFNRVRPDYGCTLKPEFISGAALGDPHIKTIDGRECTMNGLGEYILLRISEQDFMLQARTRQVLNSQGNKTAATVFVAFAAKEGNYSRFQVELDSHETGMVIVANSRDVTNDFYNIKDYNDTFDNESISIKRKDRENRTTVVVNFPSGLSLSFYVGVKNVEISVDIPVYFKGKTSGLMGNFNDDPDDDFMLPDGTILSPNSTERILFEKFGKEWEVTTSTTVFIYPPGESALDYQFPDFKPLFKEEIDPAKLKDAELKCGDNDACKYDFILTGDEKFAANTKNSMIEASKTQLSQTNSMPVLRAADKQLNSRQQWEVIHGQTSNFSLVATDSDAEDTVKFVWKGTQNSGVVIDGKSGVLTYTSDINSPVTIGVQAVDSRGGISNILYIDVVVCPDCSGHGVCDRSQTQANEKENGRFVLNACICWPAYTDANCESNYDACLEQPCLDGQKCIDQKPDQQGNSTIGYICGSCPVGFEERNNFCVDKNECILNGTDPVCPDHSECENSVGSFSCSCQPGYRLDPKNVSSCKDVDECAEKTHNCQQLCENSEGGFNCSCLPGNTLNADKKTCKQDENSAALCKNKGCNQVCTVTNSSASCGCNDGFMLSNDTYCSDVNECTLSNKPCSQSCENNVGGFLCSCYPGYKLDLDGVTCHKCEVPYYGVNCSKICLCNGYGTCNPVRGCECRNGWTGEGCNQDVNECSRDGSCPAGQLCVNTLGSYTCKCPSGYNNVSGQCKDINECANVLDNNCDLALEVCNNNDGSYSCSCREGFTRDKNNICQDIDECSSSTHNCEQICVNTAGSFNCKCSFGFTLDLNRASCVKKDVDVCAGSGLNCSDICTVDLLTKTPYCLCKTGYSLQGSEKCVDVNECGYDHLNLCGQKDLCKNTVGGYSCSCLPGFKLDNDRRTCIACSQGKWGQECSNDCGCSTGADRCDPQKGCICKPGLTGIHCDKDLDECTTGVLTCDVGKKCVNTFGSASCQCLDGYTEADGTCQDINECASLQTNTCDQICQNYNGRYTCACHSGYKMEPVNATCKDIDECSLNLDGCEQNCENTNGGYHCSCLNGLKLNVDGVTCEVSSKCLTKSCSDKCAVVDRVETCLCPKGKLLDPNNDSQCIDADMCKNNSCSDGCVETPDNSSFVCTCPKGKKLALDGITCQTCTEGTYGDNCTSNCSCVSFNTVSCDKVSGACSCKPGWTGSNCDADIDECSSSPTCQADSSCVNTRGSYICKCNKGFYMSGSVCLVCPTGTYGEECKNQCTCDLTHSTCDKVTGNCTCTSGWTRAICDTDLNECDNLNNDCLKANRSNWVCKNTPGSYTCTCDAGYEDKNNVCVDADECAASYSNECDGDCTNTAGSYTCSCPAGYRLASDEHKCDDVDECVQGTSGCQQKCTNEVGNFSCSCFTGYTVDETDWRKCYESSGYGFQVEIFLPNVSGLNLREKQRTDYINLKAKLESCIKSEIIKKVPGLRLVSINNMRHGSVIVDFTTAVDTTVTSYAASKMVEAILSMAEKGIMVDGVLQNATVIVGSVKVPPIKDKCTILNALEPCGSDATCDLNGDGEAYCKDNTEQLNVPLIVGLCVGLPLAVACIVTIILCIRYKKKYQAQMRVHERESNYVDRPETPKDNIFSVVPPLNTQMLNASSEKEKLVADE